MNYFAEKNNKVFISGEIVTQAEFSHEVYGEGFYEMYVLVKRLSGQGDILPVTVSERLISDRDLKVGVTTIPYFLMRRTRFVAWTWLLFWGATELFCIRLFPRRKIK